MADRPDVKTQTLSRDDIAKFAREPRSIKFFENLGKDVGTTIPDAIESASENAGSVIASQSFIRREPAPSPLQLSQESSERVLAQASFQPRAAPLVALPTDGDASRILATQIFGA